MHDDTVIYHQGMLWDVLSYSMTLSHTVRGTLHDIQCPIVTNCFFDLCYNCVQIFILNFHISCTAIICYSNITVKEIQIKSYIATDSYFHSHVP